ncbi:phosphotyrosine protein phosphatase [Candidatus Endobugula sertula]|uniref:protein-tyrosine-phosphatase n=1 Tax=Candidatus Endobugula sertula TaxID=62101 RepID=A0A1D2QRC2_9GAMM|nr:phosphotyrosine protein phosphatase [Candidatus Endobugula sertula]
MSEKSVNVLFVCLGNICRSPTAHALFQTRVNDRQLEHSIMVDSAGTGEWHIGCPPDKRAQKVALTYGYDMSHLQARQVSLADFSKFDYILGMDKQNLADLSAICPDHYQGVLGLFLREAGIDHTDEVPDPFYGDEKHFENAIQLIINAVDVLLDRIQKEHNIHSCPLL